MAVNVKENELELKKKGSENCGHGGVAEVSHATHL